MRAHVCMLGGGVKQYMYVESCASSGLFSVAECAPAHLDDHSWATWMRKLPTLASLLVALFGSC